jgi:regulator of Ty1 transposition protein 103
MDPEVAVPSAPVYAARLNGLLKTLASAESAVAECVKAREQLVSGLEKLLDENRDALEADQKAANLLLERKTEIEDKKQQVEVAIMRALGPAEGNGLSAEGDSGSPHTELDRPEMEALTPPLMEDLDADQALEASETAGAEQAPAHSIQSVDVSTNGSKKRRRLDDSSEFPDLGADDGIDPEVAEMLKDTTKA